MNYKCLWQQITSSQSFDSDTRTTSDILPRIRRVRIQYRFRAIVCVGATRQTFHTQVQPIHNDVPAHDDLVRISLRKKPECGGYRVVRKFDDMFAVSTQFAKEQFNARIGKHQKC